MKSYDWAFILSLLVLVDCTMIILIAAQVSILFLFIALYPTTILMLLAVRSMDQIEASIEKSMALMEVRK